MELAQQEGELAARQEMLKEKAATLHLQKLNTKRIELRGLREELSEKEEDLSKIEYEIKNLLS